MNGDLEGCYSDAQRFCVGERAWLIQTAKRASQRRGLGDYAEDIVQDVINKAKEIPDQVWSQKKSKKAYVARVIINSANDLCDKGHEFSPLSDNMLASTPTEAVEAAIMISELYNKLSLSEQDLLELIFLGFSGAEIAAKLKIEFSAARKRISRLMGKLSSMSQGKEVSSKTESRTTKRVKTVN